MDIDAIDHQILQLLKQDSQLSHKQIGECVHRTGQAVGARIQRLIDVGVLQKYTIQIYYPQRQFIRLFLQQPLFSDLEQRIKQFDQIENFYKVAGQACYMIVAHFDIQQLNAFIEVISPFARYSVETVLREVDLNKTR